MKLTQLKSFWLTTIVSAICRVRFVRKNIRLCRDDGPSQTPSPSPLPQPPQPKRPLNILVLFGDDWRHNSIGILNPIVQTPTLNALAANGIHFVNSYVTTSVCWVSRATYFTGQYMSRHNTTRVGDPQFYQRWNTTSWPALLQQSAAQYYVGHIGKWQFHNPNQFVESAFNFTSIFEYHVQPKTGVRFTEHTINETVRFLDEHGKLNNKNGTNVTTKPPHYHPFALTLAMFPPKSVTDGTIPSQNYQTRDAEYRIYQNTTIPIVTNNINDTSFRKLPYFLQSTTPPTESRRRYEQKYIPNQSFQENMQRYYALITEVDRALDRIIQLLKARGLYQDTVILFTTDNGYLHGEHGLSGKWYPYQESIRTPLIISDPRLTTSQRNTTRHEFIFNIDLAPTILSIGNVTFTTTTTNSNNQSLLPQQQQLQMQGMDITRLYLSNGTTTTSNNNNTANNGSNSTTTQWRENEVYYEHPTIQSRTYLTSSTALITLNYSYMIYPEWNNYEVLYDLIRDPFEQTNVVNETNYRAIVQWYRQRHAIWKERVK